MARFVLDVALMQSSNPKLCGSRVARSRLGTVWPMTLALVSLLGALGACSGDVTDEANEGADGAVSTIGKRCSTAKNCDVGQICKSDFAFERRVCTEACTKDEDCPSDAVCVDGISDYNGQSLEPFCLRVCASDAQCGGSECDARPAGEQYCF